MKIEELEQLKVSQLKKMYDHLYGTPPKGIKKDELVGTIYGAFVDLEDVVEVRADQSPASVRIRRIRAASKR